MLFWIVIRVALKSLLANKLRSFLAMLGIIIGVGAVISMLAFGAGAQRKIRDQMTAMGTNLLIIRPGLRGTGGVISGSQQNMTLEDVDAILKETPSIDQAAPVVNGSAQVKFSNKNNKVNVLGTSATYFAIRNFEIEKGRSFTEDEAARLAHVAVLGPATVENLFGGDEGLGQQIKVNGVNFLVVGIMKSKGDQGFFNPDDQVVIPYSTGMKQVFGVEYLKEIDIQIAAGADIYTMPDNISVVLRKRHRITANRPDDFTIRNQAQLLETASESSKTMTYLLGGIASISLLVGGIGIMNIMLVTVTERTREIGVRKAIGAKDKDILRQFLIEAIIMSGLGGLIGVAMGIGSAELVNKYSSFPTIVEIQSVLISLSFSAAVGVFFGYYPARRAAKLNPIDALRYE